MDDKIKTALQFLQTTDFSEVNPGKYNLDESTYYNVDVYMPKKVEDGKFESHRKYVDVQYVIEGEERIYVSDIKNLNVLEPYDENKDIAFYKNNNKGKEMTLHSGEYAIFYPEDGHMPSIATDAPQQVKKVVVKVSVE